MPRIVLDTDIGSDCDDSVALVLALAPRSPTSPRRDDRLVRLVPCGRGTPGAARVRVATAVDAPRFMAHVRQRLGIGR